VDFIASTRVFLIDLDGTLYLSGALLPGAREFMNRVQESGRRFFYLTNNSSQSKKEYEKKLKHFGLPVHDDSVITSGMSAGRYLESHFPGKKIYVAGTAALVDELSAYNIQVCTRCSHDADAVLLGFDRELTYDKLAQVCDLVARNRPFFATNEDLVCPLENNRFIPDCGSMAQLITAATQVNPVFLGKPRTAILDVVFSAVSCKSTEITLIGDRLYTDIALAENGGLHSILVLTGETSSYKGNESHVPHSVVSDLRSITPFL
jgi:HAD superfamily hydrolase (TIGR01450 family)